MNLEDLDNLDSLDGLDALDALDNLDALDATPMREAKPISINPSTLEGMVQEELEEISEKLTGFKARAKEEDRRFELATDPEYLLVLTFQTRAQADAYLAHFNLPADDKYVDGYRLARQQGVVMPYEQVPYNTSSKPDRKLAALTREELE